jgi:hypothetical protein
MNHGVRIALIAKMTFSGFGGRLSSPSGIRGRVTPNCWGG